MRPIRAISRFAFVILIFAGLLGSTSSSQERSPLEQQLLSEPANSIAEDARELGDATRGAVLFHQPWLSCTQCHAVTDGDEPLGPHLGKMDPATTNEQLIMAILEPSREIKKGYETTLVETVDGATLTGLLVSRSNDQIRLRDPSTQRLLTLPTEDIDTIEASPLSIMPNGLIAQLNSRQQFLDLLAYLMELRDGGLARARQLQPLPSQYASQPLPEYEAQIDHAGMLGTLDNEAYQRGEAIYQRLCVNCHGTASEPGSLPTSLKFASGKFKNGHDPFSMYQTLTRGFGLMVAQRWMVPQQKYDVIHYIRESYLREHNPDQYFEVTDKYLAELPKGDSRGPEPSNIEPWQQMDYGPSLIGTFEIGNNGQNFAYKGNAIRLDAGPGGVASGRDWIIYDLDTMRVAAAWQGQGFVDWNGINFNGRHGIHPRIVGDLLFQNLTGPGWAGPDEQSFEDPRFVGRDDRKYGPLPQDWAHYKGMYSHGPDTVLKYTVGETELMEMPAMKHMGDTAVILRHLHIRPNKTPLVLQVAHLAGTTTLEPLVNDGTFVLSQPEQNRTADDPGEGPWFDGKHYVSVNIDGKKGSKLNLYDKDFTILARIKTRKDGVIFAKTEPGPKWVPDGKAMFIRGGRLTYDIGWVGAVSGGTRIDDHRWHTVAAVYEAESEKLELWVDGKRDGTGRLTPSDRVSKHEVRIGFSAPNFPPKPNFEGAIEDVHFYQRTLAEEELVAFETSKLDSSQALIAHWALTGQRQATAPDSGSHELVGKSQRLEKAGDASLVNSASPFLAGVLGDAEGVTWSQDGQGNLRLEFPISDRTRQLTIYHATDVEESVAKDWVSQWREDDEPMDLTGKVQGGPTRWPEVLETTAHMQATDGPFAVDVLDYPEDNPWFCRMRLTGFDFFEGGDAAAVADWDGNIWLVEGLNGLPERLTSTSGSTTTLTWKRIASGLFQPLGVKIVEGQIYVCCRDQICILHDLNGDGETDWYQNFNNDHQVTDHFHEFAMGLQRDNDGNFYYAKSARHALTALVPHHGTLLKVSPDGKSTEILANGFRAANGVCLNPDGSFFVTDQEGHWNPKNRINWVRPGGFYGNMFGYHNVTDSSDSAMEQPLCWITNSFDRSPSELLWADTQRWGPLNGVLLNLSYGYGKVYVVPHEKKGNQLQGGMCELPIPQFPTGTMRGRFRPEDGQLYLCGMFAWAGTQHQNGGFYRLRYTGEAVHLPIELNADPETIRLTFSGELDEEAAQQLDHYSIKVWDLKRTANYGSKHYNTKELQVTAARISPDRRSVELTVPGLQPTWCMEIRYSLRGSEGEPVNGMIHNTIHSTE